MPDIKPVVTSPEVRIIDGPYPWVRVCIDIPDRWSGNPYYRDIDPMKVLSVGVTAPHCIIIQFDGGAIADVSCGYDNNFETCEKLANQIRDTINEARGLINQEKP